MRNWLRKARVYISFADLDSNAVAGLLHRAPANAKLLDPATLKDQTNVERAIRRSHAVIHFSSANSRHSEQVIDELATAQRSKVPIINYPLEPNDWDSASASITISAALSDFEKGLALEQSLSKLLVDKKKQVLAIGAIVVVALFLASCGGWHLVGASAFGQKHIKSRLHLNMPSHALLPGELATLDVPPEIDIPRAEQRLWIGFANSNGSIPAVPTQPVEQSRLAELARAAAMKIGLPLEVSLGWGTETLAPYPGCVEKLPLGVSLPPGIKYPIDSVDDAQDSDGNWYGTAERLIDGARVSVIPTADGWVLVDQAVVNVGRYMKFLRAPDALQHLTASAQEAGQAPRHIKSLRGRAIDPLRGLESTGNTANGWAKCVIVGPRFHDASPDRSLQGYIAYPSTAWPEDHIHIDPHGLPGHSTACLPVIGISYVEADAYRRWINHSSGSHWTLPDQSYLSLQSKSSDTFSSSQSIAPTNDSRGRGLYGLLWFGASNVLEYQKSDMKGSVIARGEAHFSGRSGEVKLDRYDRAADISFRLVQVLEAR